MRCWKWSLQRSRRGTAQPEVNLGFTLIELFVVITIIAILAGMLFPAISRGKQKTKIIRCLNNLKQLGTGIMMYVHDSGDRFPPRYVIDVDGLRKDASLAIGGRDCRPDNKPCFSAAVVRPLYPYLRPSEVFQCSEDKGIKTVPCMDTTKGFASPTCWEALGCSYIYNTPSGYWLTRITMEDRVNGIAGKPVTWVPNPSLYILMNEPPARSFYPSPGAVGPYVLFTHWHYASGNKPSGVWIGDVPKDSLKFLSPILFVDGHAASIDFTRNIKADPYYPFEPTSDWIWYKPRSGASHE